MSKKPNDNINRAKLLIKSQKKLFLNTNGGHNFIFGEDGLELKEIRDYTSGDDIRHINWRATAKKRDVNVNVFSNYKQLNIVLVYLNSGGIYFGSKKSKQDIMIKALSTLAISSQANQDLLQVLFYSNKKIKFYPFIDERETKNNTSSLHNIIDIAYNLSPLNCDIDYDKLSLYLLKKINKKSVIFLLGDFLKIPNLLTLSSKHELYCIVFRDKLEERLNFYGKFNVLDTLNTQNNLNINLDKKSIKKYNKNMKKYDNKLFSYFDKLGIKSQKIYTDDNLMACLVKLCQSKI